MLELREDAALGDRVVLRAPLGALDDHGRLLDARPELLLLVAGLVVHQQGGRGLTSEGGDRLPEHLDAACSALILDDHMARDDLRSLVGLHLDRSLVTLP